MTANQDITLQKRQNDGHPRQLRHQVTSPPLLFLPSDNQSPTCTVDLTPALFRYSSWPYSRKAGAVRDANVEVLAVRGEIRVETVELFERQLGALNDLVAIVAGYGNVIGRAAVFNRE